MGPLIIRTFVLGLICFGPLALFLIRFKSIRKEHYKFAALLIAAAVIVFCALMFIMYLEGA